MDGRRYRTRDPVRRRWCSPRWETAHRCPSPTPRPARQPRGVGTRPRMHPVVKGHALYHLVHARNVSWTALATARQPSANPPGQSPSKIDDRSPTTDGTGSTIAGQSFEPTPARNRTARRLSPQRAAFPALSHDPEFRAAFASYLEWVPGWPGRTRSPQPTRSGSSRYPTGVGASPQPPWGTGVALHPSPLPLVVPRPNVRPQRHPTLTGGVPGGEPSR